MATLLLTAVGTALGGPLGGAIGSIIGQQVDMALLARSDIRGPRLKDLTVQTSSYGAPLPLHFGRIRAAGTVIWSTELIERTEQQGGGKGRPSATTYAYSASFAVALSARPIAGVGRIWADGNLLRGAAGDLKTGGSLRVYTGHGDQGVDPLMAQAEGVDHCPAFRQTAYVVFEDLELADFGNRLPSLTFEILAEPEGTSLQDILTVVAPDVRYIGAPRALAGFTIDRGTAADTLEALSAAFPLACGIWGEGVQIVDAETIQSTAQAATPATLPACVSLSREASGEAAQQTGISIRRAGQPRHRSTALRYYDVDRDYQPGLQRGQGRTEPGEVQVVELPAAMTAAEARGLADAISRQSSRAPETALYRLAQVDRRFAPGCLVRIPNQSGIWRVDQWEWQAEAVSLNLTLLHRTGEPVARAADAGRLNPPLDLQAARTILTALELPWDGAGAGDMPMYAVAASAASAGWTGAALFIEQGPCALVSVGTTGRRRAVIGMTLGVLPPATPLLLDRASTLDIQLAGADLLLTDADFVGIAGGANRALVGREVVQFASAIPLGDGRWRISHFLRGRGGTESETTTHVNGEPFVLLDGALSIFDPQLMGDVATTRIVASGLGDPEPVSASVHNPGLTRRPLSPVHGWCARDANGSLRLRWTRRARGCWTWLDEVDLPLNEQAELWDIQLIGPNGLAKSWQTGSAALILSAEECGSLPTSARFEVRQIGSFARSLPLVIPVVL